ncbi:hypothetical protein L1887_44093 [Cichorium endivia]|nr:hypothetical protein L1887_44093 [Cichorium endivia]
MAKERALTLEALRVMDAIDRRGSFAAAADELGRVPSALSYTMQKLEEELDVVLFDRSGHRTKFTNVGRMLLERGRVLLEAADKLTTDAEALARGWETHLTLVTEALVPTEALFPLVDRLAAKANTQLSIITEVLAGAWERLETGRADIILRKGDCALSARNTPAKWISLWRGAATAWAKPNPGVYAKFRSFLPTTINKDIGPDRCAPPGHYLCVELRIRTKAVLARRAALAVENQNHDPANKRDQQQQ